MSASFLRVSKRGKDVKALEELRLTVVTLQAVIFDSGFTPVEYETCVIDVLDAIDRFKSIFDPEDRL